MLINRFVSGAVAYKKTSSPPPPQHHFGVTDKDKAMMRHYIEKTQKTLDDLKAARTPTPTPTPTPPATNSDTPSEPPA